MSFVCSSFQVDFDRVLAHKQALIDASPLLSGCVSEAAKTDTCKNWTALCEIIPSGRFDFTITAEEKERILMITKVLCFLYFSSFTYFTM